MIMLNAAKFEEMIYDPAFSVDVRTNTYNPAEIYRKEMFVPHFAKLRSAKDSIERKVMDEISKSPENGMLLIPKAISDGCSAGSFVVYGLVELLSDDMRDEYFSWTNENEQTELDYLDACLPYPKRESMFCERLSSVILTGEDISKRLYNILLHDSIEYMFIIQCDEMIEHGSDLPGYIMSTLPKNACVTNIRIDVYETTIKYFIIPNLPNMVYSKISDLVLTEFDNEYK